jgi:hypothetical protein
MDRHYYGAKIALVIIATVCLGLGAFLPASNYRTPMARLHYSAATEVEVVVLRASAKISHVVLTLIHRFG